MTASLHVIAPRIKNIKKLHVRSVDRMLQEYYQAEQSSDKPVLHIAPDIPTEKYLQQFKDWCMPEQAMGYIKASPNDLL